LQMSVCSFIRLTHIEPLREMSGLIYDVSPDVTRRTLSSRNVTCHRLTSANRVSCRRGLSCRRCRCYRAARQNPLIMLLSRVNWRVPLQMRAPRKCRTGFCLRAEKQAGANTATTSNLELSVGAVTERSGEAVPQLPPQTDNHSVGGRIAPPRERMTQKFSDDMQGLPA
jgi:hypothetical protein